MRFGEAWNQAAETTGVDQVGADISFGLAIVFISLEVVWWVGIGLFIKIRQQRRDVNADEL
ncbi:MAG TPA: hypothetical protein QF716_04765 [Candidatus Thalassarchaeaceae archaeon]|jgi:hypothetical protein|nr:hypothetical protein [Candidatus Thalassarchaeaceae archaeon]HJM68169.1 hypothetical protein [Candidatus Thalassarchaeaceae archaeon]